MRKASALKQAKAGARDDLRPEYRFDYKKSRPNPYAGKVRPDSLMVSLEPDIAQVFTSAKAVNAALRAIISALPAASKKKAA